MIPLPGGVDAGAAPIVLAFDVGGTSVKAAAVDAALTPLAETRLPTRAGPAAVLGLGHQLGALRPGHRADLVVTDAELRSLRVMRAGEWVR